MRCLRSSRSVMHVLYTLSCRIPHILYLTGFKSGEFGGRSRGSRRNSGVSLLAKTAFFNDVPMSHHYPLGVQVLIRHFTIFQSRGLSWWFVPKITKSCLNLSKLQPKYCQSLFSGHGVELVLGGVYTTIPVHRTSQFSSVQFVTLLKQNVLRGWESDERDPDILSPGHSPLHFYIV